MENSHTWAFNGITECTASYVSHERYYREWLWHSSSTGTVSVVLSRAFLRTDRSAWNPRAQNAVVMGIPENIVKAMPTERVHERSRLLQPGEQCRICLRSYQIGERVRRLACRHKFHIDCIGKDIGWSVLSYRSRSCCRWLAFTQSPHVSHWRSVGLEFRDGCWTARGETVRNLFYGETSSEIETTTVLAPLQFCSCGWSQGVETNCRVGLVAALCRHGLIDHSLSTSYDAYSNQCRSPSTTSTTSHASPPSTVDNNDCGSQ